MNPLLEQLHDIEGLDTIHMWPLASGWWIVGAALALFLGAIFAFIIRKVRYRLSWKYDALQKLSDLEKDLSEAKTKQTLITLSEYLRRIAIKRFSRKTCAGLQGKLWLQWLTQNDSKAFDWENQGACLINAPYAPNDYKIPLDEIKKLIHAVRGWVY